MRGFTLLELLLVLAIFGILTGAATPFLSSFLTRNNFQTSIDRIQSAITKAQNYAMDGKTISGSTVWGVCLTGNTVRLFNGSCSSPNFREDFVLSGPVSVSGLTSITFGNLRGEPSTASAILINSGIGSKTIVINEAGMVNVN